MSDKTTASDNNAAHKRGAAAEERSAVGRTATSGRGHSLAEIVHQMQEEAYGEAPWLRRQLDTEQIDAFLAATRRRYAELGVDLPHIPTGELDVLGLSDETALRSALPLQDPWSFFGMRNLWVRVHELSRRRNLELTSTPLIGTLPTGLMNARALRHPSTAQLAILFDDEIRTLAFLMSKVVASALVSSSGEHNEFVDLDFKRAERPDLHAPGAVLWFRAILESYLTQGWARTLPQWPVQGAVLKVAGTLCEGFEHFVMAHEYGHLVLNHLDGAVHQAIAGDPALTEIVKQQAQEIEADAHGLRIACDHAVEEFGSPLPGFWGAYLACKTFEIVDRALYAIATKADWTSLYAEVQRWRTQDASHPSAGLRAAMLCEMLARTPFEAEAREFAATLDTLFERLFTEVFMDLTRHNQVHRRFKDLYGRFRWEAPRPPFGIL